MVFARNEQKPGEERRNVGHKKMSVYCANSKITARIPHPTSLRSATVPPGEGFSAFCKQTQVEFYCLADGFQSDFFVVAVDGLPFCGG